MPSSLAREEQRSIIERYPFLVQSVFGRRSTHLVLFIPLLYPSLLLFPHPLSLPHPLLPSSPSYIFQQTRRISTLTRPTSLPKKPFPFSRIPSSPAIISPSSASLTRKAANSQTWNASLRPVSVIFIKCITPCVKSSRHAGNQKNK